MAYTPGPWRLGWGRADYLDIEAYFPDDGAWYAIASIDLDEHGAKPTPEQEANARMMVAAPALVEALEKIANPPISPPIDKNYWMEDIARQALAKAGKD